MTQINVGASLLAKAVCQSHEYRLKNCFREQARSHSWHLQIEENHDE
ncbi:hypothetical protein J3D47_000278 [Pseudomonas laurylsulfativorans]|nr:hypothetical protein [Pseudomonas laurylsulfativorans]